MVLNEKNQLLCLPRCNVTWTCQFALSYPYPHDKTWLQMQAVGRLAGVSGGENGEDRDDIEIEKISLIIQPDLLGKRKRMMLILLQWLHGED